MKRKDMTKPEKGESEMGERVCILIEMEHAIAAVLHSNSHHPRVNAEATLLAEAGQAFGPSDLVSRLLAHTYPSDHGGHRCGDRVFFLTGCAGDSEKILLFDDDLAVHTIPHDEVIEDGLHLPTLRRVIDKWKSSKDEAR